MDIMKDNKRQNFDEKLYDKVVNKTDVSNYLRILPVIV